MTHHTDHRARLVLYDVAIAGKAFASIVLCRCGKIMAAVRAAQVEP